MEKIVLPGSVLKLNEKADLSTLKLTPLEGFILSRIDGRNSVQDIYLLSSLDTESTAVIINKLIDLGIVVVVAEEIETKKTDNDAVKRDFRGYIFNLIELNEDVSLTVDLRKEILFLYDNLSLLTYYELLGIKDDASTEQVKDAYRKQSKRLHPDMHFRKNLGTYGPKLNVIYSKLVVAHGTLLDPGECQRYRQELIKRKIISPGPNDYLEDADEKERRLEKERQDRRQKNNPMMARIKRAQFFYAAALESVGKENWIEAQTNLKLAITFDNYNELYKVKAQQIEELANRAVSERLIQRAMTLESYGQDGYIDLYMQAVKIYPKSIVANLKLASHYSDMTDWSLALPCAEKAVRADPNNVEARLILVRILLKLKDKSVEAQKHIQKVLTLEPNNTEAKELLQKSKKWF